MTEEDQLPALAAEAANILFTTFMAVSDANEDVSARDVQRLHSLADDPAWCASPLLRVGLAVLRRDYLDLWQRYQATPSRDLVALREAAASLSRRAGPGDDIIDTLAEFSRRVVGASGIVGRLGLVGPSASRQAAQREVEAALNAARHALAAGASSAAAPDIPEPAPQRAAVPRPLPLRWPAAAAGLAGAPAWPRGRLQVRCCAVIAETHDVRTFVFEPTQPHLFTFKPGQFVTLEVPMDGRIVRRSYTISSSPSRPHTLAVTVKRVPGGKVSGWLHDHLVAGATLSLSGPHGDFNLFDAPAPKLLLLSAGSGVTPVMSMLRWLADTHSAADVVFINSVRTPADIVFHHELNYLASRMGDRLRLGIVPSRVPADAVWNGPVGRLSEGLLRLLAPDFAERECFTCGPAEYMVAARALLLGAGFPADRYHEESFGSAPAAAAPRGTAGVAPAPAVPSAAPAVTREAPPVEAPAPAPVASSQRPKVDIVFARSGQTVQACASDYILDAADAAGLTLPSSCRAGSCGSCKVQRLEGSVEMDDAPGLSEADAQDDFVLLCVSRACGERVVLQA